MSSTSSAAPDLPDDLLDDDETPAAPKTPQEELAEFHAQVASGEHPLFSPDAFWSLLAGPDGPGEELGLPFEVERALDQDRLGGNGNFYDSAVSFAASKYNPKLSGDDVEEDPYYDDLDCTSTMQQEFYTHDLAELYSARLRHYYVTNRLEAPTLVAEELKNNIYLCYKETGWPLERIAQYFRLKVMRIEAIIRLKQLEEEEEAVSPSSDTFRRLYEAAMPYVYHRQWKVLGKDGKIRMCLGISVSRSVSRSVCDSLSNSALLHYLPQRSNTTIVGDRSLCRASRRSTVSMRRLTKLECNDYCTRDQLSLIL